MSDTYDNERVHIEILVSSFRLGAEHPRNVSYIGVANDKLDGCFQRILVGHLLIEGVIRVKSVDVKISRCYDFTEKALAAVYFDDVVGMDAEKMAQTIVTNDRYRRLVAISKGWCERRR